MMSCFLDLLKFLNFSENQVILVTLDYAGLSANGEDLKEFLRQIVNKYYFRRYLINLYLRNHENIKTIIVDWLPIKARMEVFERETLLFDEDTTKKFDCRKRPVQRSL